MHKGAAALLWGESPGFGGVGGTLPPRLSPGGGNGKGGVRPHKSLQPLDSPKSHFPKRVKPAFLLAANNRAHLPRRPRYIPAKPPYLADSCAQPSFWAQEGNVWYDDVSVKEGIAAPTVDTEQRAIIFLHECSVEMTIM